ncbi:PspC domain-containing protein [Solidesulfovibrio carbinolicus]|uniref:Envelope stress response membrane protein PspC n=1 Tax=Solidesulfovibrio carbinolicus TaxID=296842 RepID=A0A4P6HH92_9BACT|nr:PspC domain-containing protein [Solidesulfovibrio carbinolicus]QAZ66357.1 envelope stress response membrane protein PspC [Solidesulfovibrio carbinolicus]
MRSRNDDFPGRRKLYRSRNGLALGVCRGLADYLGLPCWVVRAFVIVLFVSTGFTAAILYFAAAFFVPLAPETGGAEDIDTGRLGRAAADVSRRFKDLDARLSRLESHVTSREYDFDRRLGRS